MSTLTAGTVPPVDASSSSRIHQLSPHDATVLSACAEFPTFSDALAKVTQVVLPVLEHEVWDCCMFNAKERWQQPGSASAACRHACCADSVEMAVSLPAFAWDVERRLSLPSSADVLSYHAEAPLPPRKARRTDDVTTAREATFSPRLQSALDLLRRLAAICTDVSIAVWVIAPLCRNSSAFGASQGDILAASTRVCVERQWHRGQDVTAAGRSALRKALLNTTANASATLVTRCCARGLFDNLPLRQSAFAYTRAYFPGALTFSTPAAASALPRTATWATVSASAQRARRDEQTGLLATLLQTATCTVLAPLYLGMRRASEDDDDADGAEDALDVAASPEFTARLLADDGQWPVERHDIAKGTAVQGHASTFPLPTLSKTITEESLATRPAHRGTLHGLACDRYGLRSGHLTLRAAEVTATSAQGLPSARGRLRGETRGEATCRELCDVFGLVDQHSCSIHNRGEAQKVSRPSCNNLHTKEDVCAERCLPAFIEAVVVPGAFTVLFHAASPEPWTRASAAALAPGRSHSATRRSSHCHLHRAELEASASCLIVVAHRGVSSCASLPSYDILDAGHWAYDIVATHTRTRRSRAGALVRPHPLFLFVDARYVPAHLYDTPSHDGGQKERKGNAAFTFRQLFMQAVEQLSRTHQTATAAAAVKAPLCSATQAVSPASLLDTATSLSSPKRGHGEVGLRMHYVLQRMLEAAAESGTQSCLLHPSQSLTPSAPPSAGAQPAYPVALLPLHRVRLPADTLWQSVRKDSAACPATALARPRRTPVSLHPKLAAVLQEENEGKGPLMRVAAVGTGPTHNAPSTVTGDGMARMRHLLDTGRGSVLRQLPRACCPPRSWTPAIKNDRAAKEAGTTSCEGPAETPPIGQGQASKLAVLPWARKFILLVQSGGSAESELHCPRNSDGNGARQPPQHWSVFPPPPSPLPLPSCAHPRQRQWWVLDQHAVHERARLEFFLCFADTYVEHPELRVAQKHSAAVCAAPTLSREAQRALGRRESHTKLLMQLAAKARCGGGTRFPFPHPEPFSDAPATFPVVIPTEWRVRVAMVEAHLRLWGWRFSHEAEGSSSAHPHAATASLPTAVLSWPCLAVEGVKRCFASLTALTDTVEELEVVGGAAATPSPLHVIPSVILHFFVSRSCRGAIMFGDAVTAAAARQVAAALGCVEQYYVCAHGRPSFAALRPSAT